jgi:phage terminase small subunit
MQQMENEGLMPGTSQSGGRNRKSVREHRLRGTFQPSRHEGLGEPPTAPGDVVVKPGTLSAPAGVVWETLAPIVRRMGTLTAADVWAFATLCELQATLEHASAQKATIGASAIKLERQTAGALRPFWAMFGLDPASRARLHLPAAPTAENPLDRFLSRTPSKWTELK